MGNLVLLPISIALTGVLIYALPMGLTKKEKTIAWIVSAVIGSFGLMLMIIAELWQALSLMVLIGATASYIIVNRLSSSKVAVPLKERLHSNFEQEVFDLHSGNESVIEKELSTLEVLPVFNNKTELTEEPQIFVDDDISFLDERNGDHIPQVEWINPASNMEMDDWLSGQDNEKAYASTHS